MVQRRARANARAGGGSIDLAICKDANVATVVPGLNCRSGENRAVKKTEFIFEWMLDREAGHDCVLYPPAIIDQLVIMIRRQSQAEWPGRHQGIEGAAVNHIEAHPANTGHVDLLIAQIDKGGHILK